MAKRVDKNQGEIVQALRDFGASVTCTHKVGDGYPDLSVGWRGRTFLFEVKMPGAALNEREYKWHQEWKGDHYIVHSIDEAIAVLLDSEDEEFNR